MGTQEVPEDFTELLAASQAVLERLENLTTAEFALGGERVERKRLRAIVDRIAGRMSIGVQPSDDQLEEWLDEGVCEALDGCMVEPDGHCPHGSPSWLLHLGLI